MEEKLEAESPGCGSNMDLRLIKRDLIEVESRHPEGNYWCKRSVRVTYTKREGVFGIRIKY